MSSDSEIEIKATGVKHFKKQVRRLKNFNYNDPLGELSTSPPPSHRSATPNNNLPHTSAQQFEIPPLPSHIMNSQHRPWSVPPYLPSAFIPPLTHNSFWHQPNFVHQHPQKDLQVSHTLNIANVNKPKKPGYYTPRSMQSESSNISSQGLSTANESDQEQVIDEHRNKVRRTRKERTSTSNLKKREGKGPKIPKQKSVKRTSPRQNSHLIRPITNDIRTSPRQNAHLIQPITNEYNMPHMYNNYPYPTGYPNIIPPQMLQGPLFTHPLLSPLPPSPRPPQIYNQGNIEQDPHFNKTQWVPQETNAEFIKKKTEHQ